MQLKKNSKPVGGLPWSLPSFSPYSAHRQTWTGGVWDGMGWDGERGITPSVIQVLP